MGSGPGAVERWAARQRGKALHVGTYAAAIENVFRRIRDQGGALEQFYLHRVKLTDDCVIESGVNVEPTDFVGDAYLSDVCSPGSTVYRYVNVHEDPSGVSLGIASTAVEAVQTVAIPLSVDAADPWVIQATARLVKAASHPTQPARANTEPWRLPSLPPLRTEANALHSEATAELPVRLKEKFRVPFDDMTLEDAPASYPARLNGLVRLVTDPTAVLDLLDSQPWRPAA